MRIVERWRLLLAFAFKLKSLMFVAQDPCGGEVG